jgi:superfamily II DNA helicase RecQ
MHELTRVPGFSAKQARRWGDALLAAVERGLAAEPVRRLPSLPSKDGTSGFDHVQQELHERLKNWRKDESAKVGIDSAYLLNRHVLLELTLVRPATPEALRAIVGLQAWQLERYGDALLGVLRRFEEDLAAGRVELRGRWRK